jgi:hypothetical protein
MGSLEDDLDFAWTQANKQQKRREEEDARNNEISDRRFEELVAARWGVVEIDVDALLVEVKAEVLRALKKFPRPQASAHEGYAVLLEEVEELWDDIKANSLVTARVEAVQVAAMAVRYLLEGKHV